MHRGIFDWKEIFHEINRRFGLIIQQSQQNIPSLLLRTQVQPVKQAVLVVWGVRPQIINLSFSPDLPNYSNVVGLVLFGLF